MKNFHAILCSFLFLYPLASAAQVPEVLWFHQLSKENGLSNTSAYAVFQDSEGFTWIGTESGLDRFDGRTLVQYLPDPSDSTKLSGNLVNGWFFEDSAKNIWFCNDASIQCYERKHGRFRTFHVVYRGLPARSGYKAICLERDSFLWVKADGRSIFRFNIHTHEASGPIAKTIFDINIFPGTRPDGRLRYLFSIDGAKSQGVELFELDGSSSELIRRHKTFGGDGPEPALNIHRVFFEHDTAVWLSANSGIYKWNLFTGGYQAFSTGHLHSKSIAPYGKHHFIVAELKTGIYLFDKRNGGFKWLGCRLAGNPLSNINTSIDEPYVDPMGNIWLLNLGEGLIFSNPLKTKFRSLPKFGGIGGALNYDFRTMVQGAGRRVWCSTFNHGIFLLDEHGNPLRHYHPDNPQFNSLDSRQVTHTMLDGAQRLWVATAKGVSYLDPASETFVPVRDEKGVRVDNAVYLHQLRNGDILASTLLNGIFKIEKGETSWVLKQAFAPPGDRDFFTTIYEDKLGYIYVAHGFSEILIFTYPKDKLEHRATLEINGLVNGFYEDKDGKTLWIATSAGLVKQDKTELKKPYRLFTAKDGLQSNEIQSLALGRDGNLWMGAATGISMFDPDNGKFANYGLAEGAQSRQFNALSVLNHADGSIWFGGDNGITIVEPEKIGFLQTKPRLQVTEILINDEVRPGLADAASGNTNVHTIKELKLGFRENTISLGFVAIDYSAPASTQLEFMMERVDNDWVRLQKGESGFARYPNLPPGKYAFKIRAANSDGAWTDEVKELSITITPPWYKSWWARALFILLGALLLYAAYRFRINQIRKAEAFKRREAEYKQLVAENETAVLRLQMNPHFLFNSMNSISSYILQKDIDTANDYLNRFARLMRLILKFSEKPFISVSQEMELLELYLNTEAMRFEDKIDYEFKVDGLDPDEVIIPTMILQPFIENAVWHGLAGKEGPKKVTVGFELKDGQLCCSVADNGVGRAAAGQRKPLSSTHESKAIDITTRRLRILEETEGAATALSITDLADEAGLPAGTLVEIRLPVL